MEAQDLIREIHGLMTHTAKQIDETPTGATPGYSALLGATVLPNGKLRYVRSGTGPLIIDAICTMTTTTQTVLGDTTAYRVNFNSVVYDPLSQVTTGSSWVFTAVATGYYVVLASVPLSIGGGVDWVAADRADLTIQGTTSKVLCTWCGIGVTAQPGNVMLDGFRGVSLSAGNTLYIRVVQDCGTDRNIDTTIANIIIGHV